MWLISLKFINIVYPNLVNISTNIYGDHFQKKESLV